MAYTDTITDSAWVQSGQLLLRDRKLCLGSVCPCGSSPPVEEISDCSVCVAAAARWTVTFSGITNDSCLDCDVYNGTFILEHVSGCCWNSQIQYVSTCANPSADIEGVFMWALYYTTSFGGRWVLQSDNPLGCDALGNTSTPQYIKSQAEFDCLGSNEMTLNSSGGCSNLPATVTVSPA